MNLELQKSSDLIIEKGCKNRQCLANKHQNIKKSSLNLQLQTIKMKNDVHMLILCLSYFIATAHHFQRNVNSKGQLILKCLFDAIVSTKKPTNLF